MSQTPTPATQGAAALKRASGFFDGFKEFIARGNVVDLAVGIVIGAAFAAVVDSFVAGILDPLIAAIFGKPDLTRVWVISLNGAEILPGAVLTTLINFLIVAAAIYYVVVVPLNALAARRAAGEDVAPEDPAEDIALLTEIRDLLARQAGPKPPTVV